MHFTYLQNTFDHGQRLRIHQVALFSIPQYIEQLLAVLRLSAQNFVQASEPGGCSGAIAIGGVIRVHEVACDS
jgi:hypothetical protein